jgi:hypothetical protein
MAAAFRGWAATGSKAWTWISDGLAAGPSQYLAVQKIAAVATRIWCRDRAGS